MANEKRLIYANELTDRLNHTTMVAYPNLFPGLLAAVEIVDDAPTVDAVEVVRCKDCVHENMTTCPLCWIENHTMHFINHNSDDFCSCGERRSE